MSKWLVVGCIALLILVSGCAEQPDQQEQQNQFSENGAGVDKYESSAEIKCTSNNIQLDYVKHSIDDLGYLKLTLRNVTGRTIIINLVSFQNGFGGIINTPLPFTIIQDEEFKIEGHTGVSLGSSYRGEIKIEYTREANEIEHEATIVCTNAKYFIIGEKGILEAYEEKKAGEDICNQYDTWDGCASHPECTHLFENNFEFKKCVSKP